MGAILLGGVAGLSAFVLVAYFAVRATGATAWTATVSGFVQFTTVLNNIATVLFVVAATAAAYLARDQFRQARRQSEVADRARLATVYLEISRRWDSEEIAKARRDILDLGSRLKGENVAPEVVRDRLVEALNGPTGDHLLSGYDLVMSFFEDIGALCHHNYVDPAVINDGLGNAITTFIDLTRGQIDRDRLTEGPSCHAFTLELLSQLEPHRRFAWKT